MSLIIDYVHYGYHSKALIEKMMTYINTGLTDVI